MKASHNKALVLTQISLCFICAAQLQRYVYIEIWKKIALLLLIAFALGCEEKITEPYPYTELAMSSGMQIIATNMNGQVSIEWLSPLSRKYKWDNHEEIRTLVPRKTRFMRKLGAYDPATQSIFSIFCPIRIVADDSMLDFNSMDEVDAFLYHQRSI